MTEQLLAQAFVQYRWLSPIESIGQQWSEDTAVARAAEIGTLEQLFKKGEPSAREWLRNVGTTMLWTMNPNRFRWSSTPNENSYFTHNPNQLGNFFSMMAYSMANHWNHTFYQSSNASKQELINRYMELIAQYLRWYAFLLLDRRVDISQCGYQLSAHRCYVFHKKEWLLVEAQEQSSDPVVLHQHVHNEAPDSVFLPSLASLMVRLQQYMYRDNESVYKELSHEQSLKEFATLRTVEIDPDRKWFSPLSEGLSSTRVQRLSLSSLNYSTMELDVILTVLNSIYNKHGYFMTVFDLVQQPTRPANTLVSSSLHCLSRLFTLSNEHRVIAVVRGRQEAYYPLVHIDAQYTPTATTRPVFDESSRPVLLAPEMPPVIPVDFPMDSTMDGSLTGSLDNSLGNSFENGYVRVDNLYPFLHNQQMPSQSTPFLNATAPSLFDPLGVRSKNVVESIDDNLGTPSSIDVSLSELEPMEGESTHDDESSLANRGSNPSLYMNSGNYGLVSNSGFGLTGGNGLGNFSVSANPSLPYMNNPMTNMGYGPPSSNVYGLPYPPSQPSYYPPVATSNHADYVSQLRQKQEELEAFKKQSSANSELDQLRKQVQQLEQELNGQRQRNDTLQARVSSLQSAQMDEAERSAEIEQLNLRWQQTVDQIHAQYSNHMRAMESYLSSFRGGNPVYAMHVPPMQTSTLPIFQSVAAMAPASMQPTGSQPQTTGQENTEALRSKIAQMDKQFAEVGNNLKAAFERVRSKYQEELRQWPEANQLLRNDVTRLTQQKNELELRVSSLQSELDTKTNEIGRLNRELQSAQKDLKWQANQFAQLQQQSQQSGRSQVPGRPSTQTTAPLRRDTRQDEAQVYDELNRGFEQLTTQTVPPIFDAIMAKYRDSKELNTYNEITNELTATADVIARRNTAIARKGREATDAWIETIEELKEMCETLIETLEGNGISTDTLRSIAAPLLNMDPDAIMDEINLRVQEIQARSQDYNFEEMNRMGQEMGEWESQDTGADEGARVIAELEKRVLSLQQQLNQVQGSGSADLPTDQFEKLQVLLLEKQSMIEKQKGALSILRHRLSLTNPEKVLQLDRLLQTRNEQLKELKTTVSKQRRMLAAIERERLQKELPISKRNESSEDDVCKPTDNNTSKDALKQQLTHKATELNKAQSHIDLLMTQVERLKSKLSQASSTSHPALSCPEMLAVETRVTKNQNRMEFVVRGRSGPPEDDMDVDSSQTEQAIPLLLDTSQEEWNKKNGSSQVLAVVYSVLLNRYGYELSTSVFDTILLKGILRWLAYYQLTCGYACCHLFGSKNGDTMSELSEDDINDEELVGAIQNGLLYVSLHDFIQLAITQGKDMGQLPESMRQTDPTELFVFCVKDLTHAALQVPLDSITLPFLSLFFQNYCLLTKFEWSDDKQSASTSDLSDMTPLDRCCPYLYDSSNNRFYGTMFVRAP